MSRKSLTKMAKMMNDAGLTEVTAEYSAFFGLLKHRIHLSKQKFCPAGAAMPTGNLPDSAHEGRENAGFPGDDAGGADDVKGAVTSPMVGVIYLSPEPNSKPFVTVGKTVSEGETLCLVEAMKTFNPIKAPKAGTVADILVQDGDTVEFGTPLIIIK